MSSKTAAQAHNAPVVPAGRAGRGFRAILLLLVFYSWSLALVNTQFHHINRDECQHLTNAYRVAHGEKIYRDFWEHHMSGFYHLLAPLMRVSDQPATLYRLARVINLLWWIPGFACLWALFGRIGWSRLERAALFGTLLQVDYFQKALVEVRPDVPSWSFVMAALLVFLLAIEKERFLPTLGGGVLVGCSLVLNLKTAYTGVALVAAFAVWGVINRRGTRWVARHLFLLGAGAVVPLLFYLAWERHLGTLGDWWQWVIAQSLGTHTRERCTFITARNSPVWTLALIGLIFKLKAGAGEIVRRPAGWLALVVVGCLVLNWFVVPIAYPHNGLPFLVFVAALAILGWRALSRAPGRWPVLGHLLLAAWVVLGSVPPLRDIARNRFQDKVNEAEYILTHTCPWQTAMVKSPLTLVRRNGFYYGTYVEVSEERLWQEPERALEFAEENDCVLIQSSMPRDFPPVLQQWVEANFVFDEGWYFRRGFEIQKDIQETADYEYLCQVSGWYKLDVEPEGPVRVNGVSYPPGPVLLKQGPVRFESDLPWTRLRAAWERGDCPSNQEPAAESSAAS